MTLLVTNVMFSFSSCLTLVTSDRIARGLLVRFRVPDWRNLQHPGMRHSLKVLTRRFSG